MDSGRCPDMYNTDVERRSAMYTDRRATMVSEAELAAATVKCWVQTGPLRGMKRSNPGWQCVRMTKPKVYDWNLEIST